MCMLFIPAGIFFHEFADPQTCTPSGPTCEQPVFTGICFDRHFTGTTTAQCAVIFGGGGDELKSVAHKRGTVKWLPEPGFRSRGSVEARVGHIT